ncbi:hypothetical protein DL765_006426 [Monosporascus sp. GIB2]|nr:hypothetical protein DL765_006426 [Monosporascus sp. GIB2]
MASSVAAPSLPHRTISTIRAGGIQGGAAVPHTPTRTSLPGVAAFGSPSSLRADDDLIIVELGSRKIRVGFAGDSAPKRIATFGPEQQRRVGDFRAWDPVYRSDWRARSASFPWGFDYELWRLDIRGQDLGLVGDRLERELRDAYTRFLLLDSKPRRVSLVLPPTIPIPLLSTVLDTIFHRFQAPSISLLSSPVMAALAAGTRSALVVDLGWHETIVTGVYEFREVHSWRTVRAGKMLTEETYNFLVSAIEGPRSQVRSRGDAQRDIVSFAECEEVATRLLWCNRKSKSPAEEVTEGLPTLHEQDESQDESETTGPAEDTTPIAIDLNSCEPPRTLQIPFSQLAEPCETVFFENRLAPSCFDDHELPVHLLIYRALLQLPMDVRAMCMSRIIFTGGCSNIIGLKGRIFDEVSLLAQERGWDPVVGKGVEQYRTNPKLNRNSKLPNRPAAGDGGPAPIVAQQQPPSPPPGSTPPDGGGGEESGGAPAAAAFNPADARPEEDQVERMIRRERGNDDHHRPPPARGTLRAVDSLGPWCGASMAAQLKVPALAVVDRDLWLQHGVAGASRPGDIDVKAHHHQQQRHSVGAGGLIRGQGGQPGAWTLGIWGAV